MQENLINLIKANARIIEEYAHLIRIGTDATEKLFKQHDKELAEIIQKEIQKGDWIQKIPLAEKTLKTWEEASGKKQNYTPEELAQAWCEKETANHYQRKKRAELCALNSLHDAAARMAVREISEQLIEEGKKGQKLAVIELSARISPSLNFPGSSNYLNAVVIPYAQDARTAIGEKHKINSPMVSKEAIEESALNAARQFRANKVLAETSAAPNDNVPKSRKKPQIYICELTDGKTNPKYKIFHKEIDTQFREKFDSQVREYMFTGLINIYGLR